jgi:rfaE bifunctional protein kinase chain/domain
VAHNQQVVRVDKENSSELDGDLVDQIMTKIKRHIKDIDGLIISDYGKGVITYELLSELIPMANRLGVFVAVDPKEAHFMNYQNVSVITPNHHEAGFVSGKKIVNDQVLMDVGWNLLDLLNLESLLITLGEKGMALFERDRTFTFLPVEAKTVYDVTGAGDTVIATLTVAKTAGADIKEAALMSNVAAGLSVAKLGTAQISTFELEKAMSDRK